MEKEGFLAKALNDFHQEVRKKYPKHFDAAFDANRYAQQLQYKIEIKKNYTDDGVQIDTDHILAAILYSRTVSSYQAFLLVSQRGMAQQAKMLLRCMFETLFPLVSIQKNEGYAKRLIAADECDRLKTFNKIIRLKYRQDPNDAILEEVKALAEISKRVIEENKLKKIGVADNAENAGLLDWYDTAYSLLSGTVHASIRSLQESLVLDSDDDIICLKNEPEIDELGHLYAIAIESILFAVIAIGEIFKIDIGDFASKTHSIIGELIAEDD